MSFSSQVSRELKKFFFSFKPSKEQAWGFCLTCLDDSFGPSWKLWHLWQSEHRTQEYLPCPGHRCHPCRPCCWLSLLRQRFRDLGWGTLQPRAESFFRINDACHSLTPLVVSMVGWERWHIMQNKPHQAPSPGHTHLHKLSPAKCCFAP